jgi:hypothetical protein
LQRTDAGQHTDQRSEKSTHEAEPQVLQRQRDAESEYQIIKEIHVTSP